MWVRFLSKFDWYPDEFKKSRRSFVRYKAGSVVFVPRACGNEAVAAGKAERTSKPKQEAALQDVAD